MFLCKSFLENDEQGRIPARAQLPSEKDLIINFEVNTILQEDSRKMKEKKI